MGSSAFQGDPAHAASAATAPGTSNQLLIDVLQHMADVTSAARFCQL
jgi:hypothetical protein